MTTPVSRAPYEELLFRPAVDFFTEETAAYYRGKTVLISGGGGSVGSELARQVARMAPKRLILLDIYENHVYERQQELSGLCPLSVEILSVCNAPRLRRLFAAVRPDIVLHAAAHKHVPLMEHNVAEAVENNVFGTVNIADAAQESGAEKLIMVSTDKAVNPVNVMGATKRLCEMLVLARARQGPTAFSCTRFGNVLGSAGSVVPLFARQIANGGPVTLTDRRVVRYLMTITEAAALVLTGGALSQSGEVFVPDIGRPVPVARIAQAMVRRAGREIPIVETGLRPGEKLYEELLGAAETRTRIAGGRILVGRETPCTAAQIAEKLALLRAALETGDDDAVRAALHRAVPTYKTPEEVNAAAAQAKKTPPFGGGGHSSV